MKRLTKSSPNGASNDLTMILNERHLDNIHEHQVEYPLLEPQTQTNGGSEFRDPQ